LVTNHVESLRLQNFNVKEIYMQKKLIALAIAGLSGAAFAQSNVTVYGVADVNFEFTSGSGGSPIGTALANSGSSVGSGAGVAASANTAVTGMSSKNRIGSNASYFGLKGAEDLGGGMKAVYQIENELDISGATGNTRPTGLANRDSFVGLAGSFGTVAAGWLSSPHRSMAAKFDLMPGAAGAGSSLNIIGRINVGSALNPMSPNGQTTHRFGNSTFTPSTTVSTGGNQMTIAGTAEAVANNVGIIGRHSAIAYISPNFNGFQGTIAYVANETKDNNALGTSATNNSLTSANNAYGQRDPKAWNVKFDYDNGPLSLGYSYLDIKDFGVLGGLTALSGSQVGTPTNNGANGGLQTLDLSGKESTKAHLFGAKYTFGGATTVSFMYDRTKTTLQDGPNATANYIGDVTVKRSNWYLGLKHSMGAHDFTAAYAKAGKNSVNMGSRTAIFTAGSDFEGGSDANMWTLRYGYNFSKRTSAYAQYATIRNGSNASFDFTPGSTPVMGTGNGGVTAGADPTIWSFGVRHNF
ncbi:partial Major outer membrane protein P.IA, partial [Rhodocyclaceae bacterium]